MHRVKGYRDGIEPEIKPKTPEIVMPPEVKQELPKFDFESKFT